MLDLLSKRCRDLLYKYTGACIGWYVITSYIFEYRIDPVTELSVVGTADLFVLRGKFSEALRSVFGAPDIGWALVGRVLLSIIVFPVSILCAIWAWNQVVSAFHGGGGGGGGGTPGGAGRKESFIAAIKRLRGK
jgi:hypothetical protein